MRDINILVLGVGNILFGDEGLGVHLASLLHRNYCFFPVSGHSGEHGLCSSFTSEEFNIVDGGTLGPHLIPLMADYRRILLLDCLTANGAKPGDIFSFDYNKIPANIGRQGSAHEVEMHQTLSMMRMAGDIPEITVVAAVPEIISETSFTLSPTVLNAAPVMTQKALEILAHWGVGHQQVDTLPLSEIAAGCCGGERDER